jgi:hypothetical protein
MSALMVGIYEQRVQKCIQNFTRKSGDRDDLGDLGECGGIILTFNRMKYGVWILNGWL